MSQIILNADDFGRHACINAAVRESVERGLLRSVSLMAGEPAFDDAVTIAKAHPSLGVGIHFTLVDGRPVLPKLKANGIKHVTLMPMMMVAGDHANNDMAGDEPDSHKSQLEAEGFTVDAYIHGIGENQQIRDLYVQRANDAWDALEAE